MTPAEKAALGADEAHAMPRREPEALDLAALHYEPGAKPCLSTRPDGSGWVCRGAADHTGPHIDNAGVKWTDGESLDLAAIEARAAHHAADAVRFVAKCLREDGQETSAKMVETIAASAADIPALLAALREATARAERAQRTVRDLARLLELAQAEAADLRGKLSVVSTDSDGVWRWMGDGSDHPESLSCPVVMWAETLREILARVRPAPDGLPGEIEVWDGDPPYAHRFVPTSALRESEGRAERAEREREEADAESARVSEDLAKALDRAEGASREAKTAWEHAALVAESLEGKERDLDAARAELAALRERPEEVPTSGSFATMFVKDHPGAMVVNDVWVAAKHRDAEWIPVVAHLRARLAEVEREAERLRARLERFAAVVKRAGALCVRCRNEVASFCDLCGSCEQLEFATHGEDHWKRSAATVAGEEPSAMTAAPRQEAPALATLYRDAARAVELYALERQSLAGAVLGQGDPRPLLGLVERTRREAVTALRPLIDALTGGACGRLSVYAGGLLTCDTTLDEDEDMVRALRADAAACEGCGAEEVVTMATKKAEEAGAWTLAEVRGMAIDTARSMLDKIGRASPGDAAVLAQGAAALLASVAAIDASGNGR